MRVESKGRFSAASLWKMILRVIFGSWSDWFRNVALRELIINNEELIVKEDFPPFHSGKSF